MKYDYISGVTWGWWVPSYLYTTDEGERSFRTMAENTKCNTVVIAFAAMQDDTQSTEIDYSECPDETQLKKVFSLAKEYDMQIILKPTVNCRDGIWRGHIYFPEDENSEEKWKKWFLSYEKYQLHYADIAQRLGADMLCVACEMVMTQERDKEWRQIAESVRKVFKGPLTWNCDKFQEDHVFFWDAYDVISSSGYYPIDTWEENLDRIEKVVEKYKKPFIFIEAGCMSTKGSPMIPNSFVLYDEKKEELKLSDEEAEKELISLKEQDDYFKTMFEACDKRKWVNGFGLWDWPTVLPYEENDGGCEKDYTYTFYGKPAEKTAREYYIKKNREINGK